MSSGTGKRGRYDHGSEVTIVHMSHLTHPTTFEDHCNLSHLLLVINITNPKTTTKPTHARTSRTESEMRTDKRVSESGFSDHEMPIIDKPATLT